MEKRTNENSSQGFNLINRAENNLTAKVFITLFNSVKPASKVLAVLGLEEDECQESRIELFWKGFRDYAFEHKDCKTSFFKYYKRVVPSIRDAVKSTRLHIRESFYNENDRDKVFNELRNTEIDIAVFTRNKIYLGEAKRKEKLGFNGRNILAHQFIRQRIMVETLKGLTGDKREIVSFIVCDQSRMKSLGRMEQVKALWKLDGKRPLIISWQDIFTRAWAIPEMAKLKKEVEMILSVD